MSKAPTAIPTTPATWMGSLRETDSEEALMRFGIFYQPQLPRRGGQHAEYDLRLTPVAVTTASEPADP